MSQSGAKRGAGAIEQAPAPGVKRSRFDKPASNGKAAPAAAAPSDGTPAVTDRAAALERAKTALQSKAALQSKIAALKVRPRRTQIRLAPPQGPHTLLVPPQAQAQAKAAAAAAAKPVAAVPLAPPPVVAPGPLGLPLGRPGAGQAQRHTLRVDDQGREIDEFGNVIQRPIQAASTLKVRAGRAGAGLRRSPSVVC